jgi:hypothetical protein
MADIVIDDMAGDNWDDLPERTGALGATWTYHPLFAPRWYIYGNRVHCGVAGPVYASGVPASADYTVEATVRVYTTVTSPSNLNLGIAGRMSTSADTYYALYYQAGETVLIKRVAGVTTSLGVWTSTLTGGGTDYTFTLEMIGTAIKGYVNGVERVSATDSAITAAGRAGLRSVGINDAATGNHIDDFHVYDATAAPSPRSYSVGIVGL